MPTGPWLPLDRCIERAGLVDSCVGTDCSAYLPFEVGRTWELDNSDCDDCDEPVDDPANGEFHDCVLVIDRNAIEDPKGTRKWC